MKTKEWIENKINSSNKEELTSLALQLLNIIDKNVDSITKKEVYINIYKNNYNTVDDVSMPLEDFLNYQDKINLYNKNHPSQLEVYKVIPLPQTKDNIQIYQYGIFGIPEDKKHLIFKELNYFWVWSFDLYFENGFLKYALYNAMDLDSYPYKELYSPSEFKNIIDNHCFMKG